MAEIRTLAVFCGSRTGDDPRYAESAEALGRGMAERGIELVYGGGGVGMMGAVASAVLAGGGSAVGIIPDFLVSQEKPGLTDVQVVDSMHERKRRMFERADGFVVLPGGLGTLDETFEIITWKQLGLHDKPIVALDLHGYWASLRALIEDTVAAGFAAAAVTDLFTLASDVEALFTALEAAPAAARDARSERL